MWIKRYKAFGLDVIQSRLATLMYRFREVIMRINDYESKKITKIDELEEKLGHINIYMQVKILPIQVSGGGKIWRIC